MGVYGVYMGCRWVLRGMILLTYLYIKFNFEIHKSKINVSEKLQAYTIELQVKYSSQFTSSMPVNVIHPCTHSFLQH